MANGNAAQRRKEKRVQERLNATSRNKPNKEKDEKEKEDHFQKTSEAKPSMEPKSPNSAAWATAIFTAVLTLVAIFQYLAYRKANQLTAANQRATLNIGGPSWTVQFSQDGKTITGWHFGYGLSNSGHSPAKRVAAQTFFSLGDARPVPGLNFDSLPQGQTIHTVIGPSGAFGGTDMYIPISDLLTVSSGKKHLFFWGWATYDDGLPGSPRRLTETCADVTSLDFSMPDKPTDPRSQIVAQWPPCPVHNCYDEECEDYDARTK